MSEQPLDSVKYPARRMVSIWGPIGIERTEFDLYVPERELPPPPERKAHRSEQVASIGRGAIDALIVPVDIAASDRDPILK